jgi:hypothetical protein
MEYKMGIGQVITILQHFRMLKFNSINQVGSGLTNAAQNLDGFKRQAITRIIKWEILT